MDNISEKLAIRDSFLQKMAERKSPEEHLRELARRRRIEWETLKRIPHAWEAFKRTQFKQRAIHGRPEYFD